MHRIFVKLTTGETYPVIVEEKITDPAVAAKATWALIKSHEGVHVDGETVSEIFPNPGQVAYVGVLKDDA